MVKTPDPLFPVDLSPASLWPGFSLPEYPGLVSAEPLGTPASPFDAHAFFIIHRVAVQGVKG